MLPFSLSLFEVTFRETGKFSVILWETAIVYYFEFEISLYLQLWICCSCQIWTAGSHLREEAIWHFSSGVDKVSITWPRDSQKTSYFQLWMGCIIKFDRRYSFWRGVHWILLLRYWWRHYSYIIIWLWQFQISLVLDRLASSNMGTTWKTVHQKFFLCCCWR